MEITRLTDSIINKIYRADAVTLLVDRDNWEIWKKVKGNWHLKEEVKRKDYLEYIKTSLLEKQKELVEFEGYGIYLLTQEEIEVQEVKLEKKEKAKREEVEKLRKIEQERGELKSLITKLRRELEGLKLDNIAPEDIKKHNTYIVNIIENLKSGDIKDTKTTREVNKNNRLELYKKEIHNYIKIGQYTSINQLCKDLKINRKTLYNLKLNDYITNCIED
jgi:hypothetical protein